MIDRVVLGTVQLGLPYGVLASEPLMPLARAEAVLEGAWDLGVRAFDTAEAYGCAADRLSGWLRRTGRLRQAHIVTKVIAEIDSRDGGLPRALDRFDGAASRTVLSHGFIGRGQWERLADASARAGAAPGQSVYDPGEVREAVSFPRTARVQAPGNIFDDRAREARGSSAVPLDCRSVYLQGVLLLSPEEASRRVRGADALAGAVSAAATRAGGSASELLLGVALRRLGSDDRVVIGVDEVHQLSSLTSAIHLVAGHQAQLDQFEADVQRQVSRPIPGRLLDPRQWTS